MRRSLAPPSDPALHQRPGPCRKRIVPFSVARTKRQGIIPTSTFPTQCHYRHPKSSASHKDIFARSSWHFSKASKRSFKPVCSSSEGLSSTPGSTHTSLSKQSPAGAEPTKRRNLAWIAAAVGLLAIAGFLIFNSGSVQEAKTSLNQSVLGRSGFLAAFSLIFISEIGDKTFFIAGLLAAKVGRWRSLIGSSAALGLMTVISVGIGSAFKSLPDVLKSSLPIGQYLGAALMLLFGVRTISEAWQTSDESETGDGELQEAQLSVSTAEKDWGQQKGLWRTLLQVGTLIFLAEWGDRSMLATIALGASHPPIGVAVGATLAHIAATFIAVVSGAIASQYVSEKTIGYIGGTLFLVFSFLTFFGYF